MVRKSVLVYDLLRSEKPNVGLTKNEIANRLYAKYGFTPGKGIKRQIGAALRRGMDYGILAKYTNKYRYDLDSLKNPLRRKFGKVKKEKVTKKRRKVINKEKVPMPTVPELPDWTPKRRKLLEEPVSKVKK
ncbi:uncharacterized protein LOC117180081 [Belonocnema kinseyi]|uniref:uncharacterized protein LOC117180081 n=1 Tax=Belonocnema kinseyi TaxID=2817044 RepID=UPI00143D22EE|nr:uncharacterized protein LOC117180081 [Belonocnema kinseyi]